MSKQKKTFNEWFRSKGGTKKHAFLIGLAIMLVAFNMGSLYYKEHGLGNRLTGHTEVHFIDVGQGDATLFLSGEQAVLIDAGPTSRADDVIAYLHEQDVTSLRAVIATHPHEDHIGGMAKVLASFDVEEVVMPSATATTNCYNNMMSIIESKNITVSLPEVNHGIILDTGAYFQFLSPAEDAEYDDLNNYSIVCMFEAGRSKVLMMGDAEAEIEQSLLQSTAVLTCDVIKVGHHGSSTSSTPDFLKRTHAETAIISCGADNEYGHPTQQTLDHLAAAGITDVRRTDEHGSIVLEFEMTTDEEAGEENAA